MIKINIKPLSVNDAWCGRRMRSPEYNAYRTLLGYLLPASIDIPSGPLYVDITFGFSSAGSDIDNGVKPFVDILQKKYGFNDNRIQRMVLTKELVKKGSEYILFNVGAI